MTGIDQCACREAYEEVRNDHTDTNWAVFTYENSKIVPAGQGAHYEDFKKMCTDDARLFAFIRVKTGDTLSKRAKFTLITWIGQNIGGLKRASISTDKTLLKTIVQNFAKEFMASDLDDLDEDYIRTEVIKAGGANYDAQTETGHGPLEGAERD